jgi:hypothetical protein
MRLRRHGRGWSQKPPINPHLKLESPRVPVVVRSLGSLAEIQAAERIGLDLHPRLEGKIHPIFLLGDYETAAFKAMKEVEVRVRELAGLSNDLIGVALMRQGGDP